MAIEINGTTGISGVDGTAGSPALQGADTNTGISFGTDEVAINTGGTERVKVDSSGRLLVHTSTSGAYSDRFLSVGDVTDASSTLEIRSSPTNGFSSLVFSDSTSAGTGAYVGSVEYGHADNYLAFKTNATERMRIDSSGQLFVAKTTIAFGTAGHFLGATGSVDHIRDNAPIMYLNRLSSDGNLIQFYQASNLEGSISVSGSTVSYNGGHLTRWSQLASGTERTEILRGSVLSNLDEMCEWGEEDNEQLNRMKVSDVEGDPNVSGVFQSWDDDDDTYTNDFYCAMTGDFVIRIAQGTTVARGDLLMSAGDGTAKPQDDDIVRSKTIAKVTSTNVSCTYDDGSYCVPCVLMAC